MRWSAFFLKDLSEGAMTILLLSANGLWSAHWLLFCSQLDNTQIIFQSIKAFSPGNGGAFGEAL